MLENKKHCFLIDQRLITPVIQPSFIRGVKKVNEEKMKRGVRFSCWKWLIIRWLVSNDNYEIRNKKHIKHDVIINLCDLSENLRLLSSPTFLKLIVSIEKVYLKLRIHL